MEDSNFIDVPYTDLKDDIYYTAVQVAEILNEPVTTIRGWGKDEAFGDLLELKKENGRRKYTKRDIDNLKFIKELIDKKYSYAQIREIISKKGFNFGEYDAGLINPNDPLGFEALSIKLAQKQDEKLEIFKNDLINTLKQFIEVYGTAQDTKLNIAFDEFNESLDFKLEKHEDNIHRALDEIKNSAINNNNEFLQELNKNIDSNFLNKKTLDEELNSKIDSLNSGIKDLKDTFKTSYVTKDEIEQFGKKKTWLGKLFK